MAKPYLFWNVIGFHINAQYRPEPKWPTIVKFFYYFFRVIILVCFTLVMLFSLLEVLIGEYEQISDVALNIVNLFLFGSIAIRSAYFMYYHKRVEYLIQRLNAVMKESTTLSFKPYTMERGRFASNLIWLTWTLFVYSCLLFLAFAPFFKHTKELPLPMWLFYDWKDDRYYLPTMGFQIFSQIVLGSSYSNIEMFNGSIHVLLKYQFELLGKDFSGIIPNALYQCGMPENEVEQYMMDKENKSLLAKVEVICDTKKFKELTMENFKLCIKHHQELLTFQSEFYEFIQILLAIELNFNFAYLIFSLFTFVTTTNTSIYIALGQYVYGSLAQIFIMMSLGELLTDQVEELRNILYDIPWYFCDRKFLINFKFVQLRMSKNEYAKAGKLIPIAMITFVEYVRRAGSFFAVLRQVNSN